MTEESESIEGDGGDSALPRALVRDKARISVVWLIPVIAAVVGLWLAFWAWSEQGPTIEIRFETAEGLEAGKTKIKFKEVEIGVVESVALSDDISQVVVTANLVTGVEPYLTETTRFWVVRAEFSAGHVSGLSTVLSGVYIAIDPSTRGKRMKRFTGLEKAPIVTSEKPGTFFDLQSRDLGSIQSGSPVYYRWLKVGQVAGFDLDPSGEFVNIKVFVERPHDARVASTTRFWNASGVDLSVDSDGLRVDSPSLVAMLVGGVAFDTPTTLAEATPVAEGQVFQLYKSKSASLTREYVVKQRFVVDFGDTSVAGLTPGAAVLFRGIKLGEVLDVDLQLDPVTDEFSTPVVIELEPERLGLTAADFDGSEIERMSKLVDRGLRARIGLGNILTGKKVVELDFVDDAAPAALTVGGAYPELPTTADPFEALADQFASILGKVDQVPVASIGANLDGALAELRETLATFREAGATASEDVLPELTATLSELEGTLSGTNRMLAPDSPLAFELERLVTDLAAAARSLRGLAERLEEHPEELLRGKSE